jgi:DNA-binding NtrC family response regulator
MHIVDRSSSVNTDENKNEEVYRKLFELEATHRGLCAKIEQLLRWGGAILLELNNITSYRKSIELQIDNLSLRLNTVPLYNVASNVLSSSLDDSIRKIIVSTISEAGGNKSKAARMLGINRRALLRKAEKYGVPKGQRYTRKRLCE